MTTSPAVHAKVKRWANDGQPDAWLALAWITDTDAETSLPINRRHRFADAPTWHDAMQAAQALRAELDRELMDEVHASRASRRAERPCELDQCRGYDHPASGPHRSLLDALREAEAEHATKTTTTKRRQPIVIGPEQEPTA